MPPDYRLVIDDTDVAAIREVWPDGHLSEPLDTWPLEDLDLIRQALDRPAVNLRDYL